MTHIEKAKLMRRAWALFRFPIRPFTRTALAAHLQQAWAEARNAPVTPLAGLQRWITVLGGESRDAVIQKLELARDAARARCSLCTRAGEPANWSAAKHRSTDIQRLGNIEAILAREIAAHDAATGRYTARRDGASFSLRREGVEFARITRTPGRFIFTAANAALTERVQAALQGCPTLPAALAMVRAANEALRTARAA